MCALVFDTSLVTKIEEIGGTTASLCYQCGTCTASCPLGVQVRKLLRDIQVGSKSDALSGGNLWSCAACKLCELQCPRGVSITDILHSLRVLSFEARKAPQKLEQALWGIYEQGNPYGGKKSERGKWADGLNVPVVGQTNKQSSKYVVYTGCASSYDPRLQNVARSVIEVFQKARAEVSILGESESCCGDVAYQIGEEGFLEELAEKNIKMFNENKVETLVTVSPHCLNMFKNVYPHFGKMPNVVHYTEILSEFVDHVDLSFNGSTDSPEKNNIAATYHDPCYLGRYYGIYEQPRKILQSIHGITLIEMKDNKDNALCCGGGGGQMWNENETVRPSHERVSQAAETNATVLATSCPYCIQNFEDAAKTKGMKLIVRDVSELLNDSLRSRK
ncbi:MAG: (Fe-S)-binding protein [Nitrososphaerota archaeon]|nr:(Fe-S)-binding protein [Nitrososphaerota archaeon]